MANAHRSLTGFWTGVYDYAGVVGEPVAFNAVLTELAGDVSGETIEPNTFADPSVGELFASLAGARDGETVSFVKTYEAARGAGHSVTYAGVIDAELVTIRGEWRAGGGRGPFVMNRLIEGRAVAVTAEIDDDIPF